MPIIPGVCLIVGLAVWLFAGNPKAAEIGKILFAVGLLVLVLAFGGETVHFRTW